MVQCRVPHCVVVLEGKALTTEYAGRRALALAVGMRVLLFAVESIDKEGICLSGGSPCYERPDTVW